METLQERGKLVSLARGRLRAYPGWTWEFRGGRLVYKLTTSNISSVNFGNVDSYSAFKRGSPHSGENSLSRQTPSAKVLDSLPCMAYGASVKTQPWEFGSSSI